MNAVRLAEGEILREGRRLLRKLMLPAARLTATSDGSFVLMTTIREQERRRLAIFAELVQAFRCRDWIECAQGDPRSYVLSDVGLGWIRRSLAENDPFAAQHRIQRRRDVADESGAIASVLVNEGESPLGWLFRRRGPDGRTLIDETQFTAGERLRADFTLAQMNPRLAVDLTAPVVAGRRGAKSSAPLPEIVLAAKQRLSRALQAVGPGLSDVLLDVCCHLIGLEAAERQKGWPQRSAKVVLTIALDRLAAHYGLGAVTGTGTRMRAWSAPETGENFAREP